MRSTVSPRKTQGSAGLIHVMKDSSYLRMVRAAHVMIMREDKEMGKFVGQIGVIDFRSYCLMELVKLVRLILGHRETVKIVDQTNVMTDKNF